MNTFRDRIFTCQTENFAPLAVLFFSLSALGVLANPRIVEFTEIPPKFEQSQDEFGFLWQVNREGAITSGETQYLPSGMKLFVNGKPFVPQKAILRDDTKSGGVLELRIEGKSGDLPVVRDLWIDLERGGVRILDSIQNGGKQPANIKAELRTAFQFPWQNLVGSGGQLLSRRSPVEISPPDTGLAVKFSVSDGRQDTVILFRNEEGKNKPAVTASSNSRELVLSHDLIIPPGKKGSLVHWMIRRNIGQLEQIRTLLSSFYDRGQLKNARVPGDVIESVSNFGKSAFPDNTGPPPELENLVSLNEMVDKLGVHRRSEDILWFSANNQLVGEIGDDASVGINGQTVGISRIAAIEGGWNMGRIPRVFLRDGRVFTGRIEMKNFSLKTGSGTADQKWNPDELNLLLLGWDSIDGVPLSNASFLIEFRSGEVMAASSIGPGIPIVTPWGKEMLALENLEELQYISRPWPQYRLTKKDGSILGVLLPEDSLSVVDVSGLPRTVSPLSILRIWRTGSKPMNLDAFLSRWNSIEEIPGNRFPDEGFLLPGNNILSGIFSPAKPLGVVDNGTVVEIDPAKISELRRLDANFEPVFEIKLKTGDSVRGKLRQASIQIKSGKVSWKVPVKHLIAFHSSKPK